MKYKIEKNTVQETLIHSAVCPEGVLRTVPKPLSGRNSGAPD